MVQIKSYTLTQYVMMIYVITTSVYADFREYHRCLSQLHQAFGGHDTLVGCVRYAIEKYVNYEEIPVINLDDPCVVNSVIHFDDSDAPYTEVLPESENHKYQNYAVKYYQQLEMAPLMFSDVNIPKTFCKNVFPEYFGDCFHDVIEIFGDSQLQDIARKALLELRLSDFDDNIYRQTYMMKIISECNVYVPATPGQISITGTDLKPSRFCENFLAPDTLPDPPEMRRKKNVNVTSTSKNVKKGKNAM